MKDQLEKAINLARKTGDRLLVYNCGDNEGGYVVMSMEEYEKMAIPRDTARNLTEDELLDKINRDIAAWKNEQESVVSPAEIKIKKDEILISDIESGYEEKNDKTESERKSWTIPSDRKEAADEVIDEDRQYLEEVSF